LNDMVRENCRSYRRISPGDIRTVLIQGEGRLLPELNEKLAAYAQKKLEQRGVEVRLRTFISNAGPDYVELKSGERIKTQLLVWSGGVAPSPAVTNLECDYSHHGSIVTDEFCRVPGYTDVWAIGDCATIPQPDKKGAYPPLAQNATREGQAVARNITATLRGEALQPFVYQPIGELAMVGKHTGVASIWGMRFSGKIAWFMWRTVYLVKMPHLSMRLRVAFDWTGDFLFGRELAELPVTRNAPQSPPTPEKSQPEKQERVVV
jgi:NADH:ubiquinone reductase (H+-translocating)